MAETPPVQLGQPPVRLGPPPVQQGEPPVQQGEPLIQIRNLHKTLGTQEVLCGVDLDIFQGETLVIFGRSGGGKSVLLKHMIGLMTPTSGEIHVHGQDIFSLNERQMGAIRKKISMLFQGAALFDSMTVEGNLAFPLKESGITSREILAKEVAGMRDLKAEKRERDVDMADLESLW